jgi:hypothetical protein
LQNQQGNSLTLRNFQETYENITFDCDMVCLPLNGVLAPAAVAKVTRQVIPGFRPPQALMIQLSHKKKEVQDVGYNIPITNPKRARSSDSFIPVETLSYPSTQDNQGCYSVRQENELLHERVAWYSQNLSTGFKPVGKRNDLDDRE